MRPFYEASNAEQSLLLCTTFLTLLLALVTVFFAHGRQRVYGIYCVAPVVFWGLFVLLVYQADAFSHLKAKGRGADWLPFPTWTFWAAVGLSLLALAGELLILRWQSTRAIGRHSIKQAMDTLPEGVCFFLPSGAVKLCNLQMHRLFHELAQSDLQSRDELVEALAQCDGRNAVKRLSAERQTYLFPDGRAWRYSQHVVRASDGVTYTEAVFCDATELYEKNLELKRQTAQLRHIARELKTLSDHALELTREQEILAAKTRLHDQMGAGLIAVRQALLETQSPTEVETAVQMFRRAVSAVKRDNDYPTERSALAELLQDAAAIGTSITLRGSLPAEEPIQRVFLIAMRECLTNSVRHADATRLFVTIERSSANARLYITNNGMPPQNAVTPRGGLLNLSRHVEACGGRMTVTSAPAFELTVTVPIQKEETI